jgi:glycine receptor
MKTWTTILILLFLFTFISGKLAKKPRILLGSWKPEDLLPASYNRLKSPVSEQSPGKPTEVRVGLNITSIFGVNEADQSYRVRCTLSQRWVEQRLNYPATEEYNRIFLTPSVVDKLWVPHIFVSNSVNDMEAMEAPLIMYEVNREKEVTVASRMSVKVACDFDLSLFPHDTQVCHVILESCEYQKQ